MPAILARRKVKLTSVKPSPKAFDCRFSNHDFEGSRFGQPRAERQAMKALLLLAAGVLALAGCASLMAAAHREAGSSEVRKFRVEIGENVLGR